MSSRTDLSEQPSVITKSRVCRYLPLTLSRTILGELARGCDNDTALFRRVVAAMRSDQAPHTRLASRNPSQASSRYAHTHSPWARVRAITLRSPAGRRRLTLTRW